MKKRLVLVVAIVVGLAFVANATETKTTTKVTGDTTKTTVKGPEGNIEFLAHWRAGGEEWAGDVAAVVRDAHEGLS